jgi:hypothetical protein
MNGATPAQIKADTIEYIQNVRTWQAAHNNFPVILLLETLTKNGKKYGAYTTDAGLAQYETYRKQINADRLANYKTDYGADMCQNYDSDVRMLDVTNTDIFTADQQHFTDAGQAIRASLNAPYLIAAEAGTFLAPKPNAG